jgi:hypothetical protein
VNTYRYWTLLVLVFVALNQSRAQPTNTNQPISVAPSIPPAPITNVIVVPSRIGLKEFIQPLATLFGAAAGALVGAYFAYRIALAKEQREEATRIERQRKERETNDYIALAMAHSALYNQWNYVESTKRDLQPFATDPERHLHMPLKSYDVEPLRVPFKDLPFLIQLGKSDFLQELHLAENNFFNLMKILHMYLQMRIQFWKPPKPQEVRSAPSETEYNNISVKEYGG